MQSALYAEQVRSQELESRLAAWEEQDTEMEELRSDLEKCKLQLHSRGRSSWQQQQPSSPAINGAQQLFLKQAVLHLLTDVHAEEQLKAIISILDFSAQERKAIYSKRQGLYKK